MEQNSPKIIYTIGHSTHTFAEFLALLQSFKIEVLVDVRRFPGSRKYPQFDLENLEKSLPENGIAYRHLEDLGGRRPAHKDSENTRWHNASFRGYADYMETEPFRKAISDLEKTAEKQTTVIMCAEAVWWRCHRSMISDFLKVNGWTVLHIMALGKTQEHPYTQAAKIVAGKLTYSDKNEVPSYGNPL